MVDVGKLIEGVLSVRHKGKWRRKLCVLEKQATFSNCLRLFVFDEDGSNCRFQDVVHAFISFLDPNRQGNLMLVCNYKVRCISFDQFDVLNKWVEVLHANLIYNYFHADLLVASRGSRLAKYAVRRPGNRLLLQKRGPQSGCNSGPRARYGPGAGASGDGYLHVTRDRICFTTGPSCSRPRLLATWNFDNGEIVQCGTARLCPHDAGSGSEGAVGAGGNDYPEPAGDESGPASLFFLTAFPDHPEAPGSYLFLSDRATELCEWIEQNNRSAVDQAEWRRLTSMAAVLESPISTPECNLSMGSPWDSTTFTMGSTTDWTLYCNQAPSIGSPCPCSTQCSALQNGPDQCSKEHTMNNRNPSPEKPNSLDLAQSNQTVPVVSESSLSSTPVGSHVVSEQPKAESLVHNVQNSPESSFLEDNVSLACSPNPAHDPQDFRVPLSDVSSMMDFHRHKLAAMHSRHRFSSYPAHGAGGFIGTNREQDPDMVGYRSSVLDTELWPQPCRSEDQSDSISAAPVGSFRPSLSSQGPRWRQSEPQLVTLSPIPIPLAELQNYLKCHSKGRTACHQQSGIGSQSTPSPGDSLKPPCTACNPFVLSGCRKPVSTTATACRHRTHLSECSVTSASESTASSDLKGPTCALMPGTMYHRAPSCSGSEHASLVPSTPAVSVAVAPVTTAPASLNVSSPSNASHKFGINWFTGRRKRLPSSWSNTTTSVSVAVGQFGGTATAATAAGSGSDKADISSPGTTAPSSRFFAASLLPPFLNRSLSSGNSPQCHITPLHPTCTVVPGSQYFAPRRRHTASASEAFSVRSGFSSGDPYPNTVACTLGAHGSTKTSLISLSATAAATVVAACSAIPLWAEAPTQAKPRTGCNYVSRELVTALHAQRKQQQLTHNNQHPAPPSPPPPPPRPVPLSSTPSCISSTGFSACYTNTAAPLVLPHPCTPVPEAPRESDEAIFKSTQQRVCNGDRIPSSSLRSDKFFPSSGSLEPSVLSQSLKSHPPTLKLVVSDCCSVDGVGMSAVDSHASGQMCCRSYINMAASSHRAGLQPIEEDWFSNNSPSPLQTQPIVRRSLTHADCLLSPSCSSQSGLHCSVEARVSSEPDAVRQNHFTDSAPGSYVNIAACASSNANRNGHSGHTSSNPSICTLPAQYINLASPTLRSCGSEVRGVRAVAATKSLRYPEPSGLQETIASTIQLQTRIVSRTPHGLPVSSSSTHLCLCNSTSAPSTFIDQFCNGSARTAAPSGHKLALTTSDAVPRLHYAHLTLSNDRDSARSPASAPSSHTAALSQTHHLPSVSVPMQRRPSLHTVHSLPGPLTSVNTSTVAVTTQNQTDTTCLSTATVPSSGLNYVTIDFVQTKALSELEQELRGATEQLDNGLHPISSSISRRINLSRVLANSATLPGPSSALETFNRTRGLERASSHSGGANGSSNGKSDSLAASFPTRVLSRLVQSLNFHNHHQQNNAARSAGLERVDKHFGGRKRLGRANGPSSSKEFS